MSATDYLSSIVYGTSTGGAAGAGETTSTIGTARVDYQQPPDVYHLANLQLARFNQYILAQSAADKGGTRQKNLMQSSNPFAVGEYGDWVDSSGFSRFCSNGVDGVNYIAGLKLNSRSVAGSITGALTDHLLVVTDTAMARTVQLPSAVTASGRVFIVLDGSGAANVNNITVSGAAGNINGAGTHVINTAYGKATYWSNGSNYFVIG